jgi:hypothetical protein
MKLIEARFILYPEAYENGEGHAGSEPENIDKGQTFILQQMTPGGLKIILEHGIYVIHTGGTNSVPLFLSVENQQ